MIQTVEKKPLSQYMNHDESFIFGVNGLLRLSAAKAILYSYMPMTFLNSYIDSFHNYSIECTLAVTDKRILFINTNKIEAYPKGKVYSFKPSEIKLKYKNFLGKKEFIIGTNNHELFDFTEESLIFECYGKQEDEINRLNMLISEYIL